MTKKKKVEKRQATSDDSSSLRSEETSSSLSAQVEKLIIDENMKDLIREEDDFPDNLVSGFAIAVERLNDKRSWMRLKALSYTYEALRNDYRPELLEKTVETLVYTLLKGPFHRTIQEERRLSCLLLASVVLTLGESSSSEYVWEHCGPLLKTMVKRGVKGSLEAIACVGMVGSTDLEDIWLLMGDISGYFLSSDIELAAEALRSWTLLASSLPITDLYHLLCGTNSPLTIFQRLFSIPSQTLHHHHHHHHEEEDVDIDKELDFQHIEEWPNASVGAENGTSVRLHQNRTYRVSEILQQLYRFRCQSADALFEENKRTPKKQRSLRKSIVRALEDQVDSEHYQLANGEEILFDTWLDKLRIQSFRVIFGSGWKKHLELNVFVRQVLSLGMPVAPVPDSELRLTKEEKRLFRSPNSILEKKRTLQRQGRRTRRIREREIV
ncbi:interferon-related developmental (IFRD) regulator family protein isoform 1 [Galdieria sulphuraria]|uniref:Interferon-related developmental (IFRD) regulator family protein isoform 1 n=1 Tax=Galdieria sulphuraria TaxID=130081 RepID=M2WZ90_GALSU|nr:interferon-related developmental (IFRD) regulator family protein isoform 1 [Galdieria sulphuraria]EME29385.1 interferon-related developmental (IFRD) regulator family protein isoform 1 [Galdieria sulphuraria]|eukprot:XP_005705905.1 interferon-related developmental (IFRD) regulator family protein isoform 1 [Galdieria sulphuraria]